MTQDGIESMIECSSTRLLRPPKILFISELHEGPHRSCCRCALSHCNRDKKPISHGRYSIFASGSNTCSTSKVYRNRLSTDLRHHTSLLSSKHSVPVTCPAIAYIWTTLDSCSYLLSNRAQAYNDSVLRRVAKIGKRLKIQLKSHLIDSFDSITSLSFLPAIQMACNSKWINEGAAMWLFISRKAFPS